MPLYKVVLDFMLDVDSASEAFEYAVGLEIVNEADEAIPKESVSTHVRVCIEDEVAAMAESDLDSTPPDNVTRIH